MTLHHFRQFVIDEWGGEDGVEVAEDDRVQLGGKSPEEKILRIETLGQSLESESVCFLVLLQLRHQSDSKQKDFMP